MQIHSIHTFDKVKLEENVQDDFKFEQSDDGKIWRIKITGME